MTATLESALSLPLDPSLEAREPAEVRGHGRDDVRLLVSDGSERVVHTTFSDLPHHLTSGDLIVVNKPFWYVGYGSTGATHGSPYAYDSNVPLMVMGKQIKPGAYGQYAEVVDIAPTLAHLLRVRPPAGAEGRVLTETLR